MPPNNMVLYAKWAPPVHSVKYFLSPGTGSSFSLMIDIPHGSTISESDLLGKIVPEGLTEENFIGWFWYVTGVFVPYDFDLPIINNQIVLYPVWDALSYEVTYDINVGSGTTPYDANLYISGSYAAVLQPTNITPPTGKVFIGWKEPVSNTVYYPNDKLFITGNMTLIAQWGDIV